MSAEAHFRDIAPRIMRLLISDFYITREDAAAIVGNGGHESLGFTKLQEMKPTVKGSRGGWGLMQWTGPRRRQFEAYCERNGFDPASEDANYGFLFCELKGLIGTEGGAIAKLKAAKGLSAKVIAFEKAFLRAGVKHYPSRLKWAQIALDAYERAPVPSVATTPAKPAPARPRPSVSPASGSAMFVLIAVTLAGLAAGAWQWGVGLFG